METDLLLMEKAAEDATQPIIYDIKAEVLSALNSFYSNHIENNLQIFHSLTVGEILICILLSAIILLFVFKWIWEVLRY